MPPLSSSIARRVGLRVAGPSILGRAPRTSCSAREDARSTKRNLLSYCSSARSMLNGSALPLLSVIRASRLTCRGVPGLCRVERIALEGVLEVPQDRLGALFHPIAPVAPGEDDRGQGLARPGRVVVDDSIVVQL